MSKAEEDQKQEQQDTTLIITGILLLLCALLFVVIGYDFMDGVFVALIAFLALFGALLLIMGADSAIKRRQYKASMKQWEKERIQQQEELNQLARDGLWEFPAEEFYQTMHENKIASLNNNYAKQKATTIATVLIERYGVDVNCCDKYLETEKLKEFLRVGREIAEGKAEEKLANLKTPKAAKPSVNEELFIERSTSLSVLRGSKKREKMLSDLISDFNGRIEALVEGEKAMKTLGVIYAQQQKKEGDWAIAGGIADGLAGPVAGFMAASQVMENNQEIQRRNATMRSVSMDILSGIPNMTSDRYKLQKDKQMVRQRLDETATKITLPSPDSDEIWNHIHVGKCQIKKAESGVLHIALPVHIETPFVLDVPDNVNTVVDGTLKAEVRFEDKLVGTVNFPLPLYGIPTNMTAEVTLDGMLDRSVEFNGEYTLKMLDSHNLWIMEA